MNPSIKYRAPVLLVMLISVIMIGAATGSVSIEPIEMIDLLLSAFGAPIFTDVSQTDATIFWSVRLPRVLLAALIGAGLGLSGAYMQGLFRNPLAEPSIIGVSAGASLSAALVIVAGLNISLIGVYGLSVITFIGATLTTFVIYRVAQSDGRVVVATMLLGGIAINALAAAGTGFLTFISDESELRSYMFWLLGSLGGADWTAVLTALPFIGIPILLIPRYGKVLNSVALSEQDAVYIGIDVKRMKFELIVMTTLAVGAAVALAGIIGFVGLVVPHILRMLFGPDHRRLLPATALGGAILLIIADIISRVVMAPAEIPIGVITALIGSPIFLSIIIRETRKRAVVI